MTEDDLRRFGTEWVDVLEAFVRKCMRELGVPDGIQGLPDAKGIRKAFTPTEFEGGGVNALGVQVDAGIFNSDLLWDQRTGRPLGTWKKARLRHRIEAVIAHEWTEFRFLSLESAHDLALQFAPQTPGICAEALALLEEMRHVLRGG